MAELRFEWDKRKEKANVKKHGISFGETLTVAAVFGKVIQLLELYLPEKLMAMKKMNIGGTENERPLRFFQNEGAQKPLYEIFKATGYYATRP